MKQVTPITVPLVPLFAPTAVLTASTAADNTFEGSTYSDWDATTPYAIGARVVKCYVPVYVSLANGNLNHNPVTSPTWWAYAGLAELTDLGALAGHLWAIGSTFPAGYSAYVVSGSTYLTRFAAFESLTAANTGNYPDTDDGTHWVRLGPTDRWAPYDGQSDTSSLGNRTDTLLVGSVDTVALLGVDGTSVSHVQKATPGGTTIYSSGTVSLAGKALDVNSSLISGNLTSTLTWDFVGAEVHQVVVGLSNEIGALQAGASPGLKDYSRVVESEFRVRSITRRVPSRILDGQLFFSNDDLDRIFQLMADLMGTTSLWIGEPTDSRFASATLFGFIRSFKPIVDNGGYTLCSISIQGF